MDLRLDIERRKKYCTQEKPQNRERDTKDCGRETPVDKFSEGHKSSKYAHLPSAANDVICKTAWTFASWF